MGTMKYQLCPVCGSKSSFFSFVDKFEYFECSGCGIVHLDVDLLKRIDMGEGIRDYKEDYWKMEAYAARQRAGSAAVIRMAEAVFLCQRVVENVIDIGTGTGFILDHMALYLPLNKNSIYGCELFPPPIADRTTSDNYIEGTIKDAGRKFDAGLCMEVVEHLTPNMMKGLLSDIANYSNDNACYFINTGLAKFAKEEERSYIDPVARGHIVFWTVPAITILCEPFGLVASPLPGRNWAFLIEKASVSVPIEQRLHSPLQENLKFLNDGIVGPSVLSIAASEAAMNYYHLSVVEERTRWVFDLQRQLKASIAAAG